MNKIQKISTHLKNDLIFFPVLLILITLAFILFSPKTSSLLFSFKRQTILSEFINKTKNNGINPQEYWKFREFYSPGYFNFSKDGINNPLLKQTKEKVGVKYNDKNIDLTFLVFSSPRTSSLDMLTNQTYLDEIIEEKQLQKTQIIFINKNTLIYKADAETIRVAFLLNNNEMKKANGFFDYKDKDKNITEGKNWFNITSIKTD